MVFKYNDWRLSPPNCWGRTTQGLIQPSIILDQALISWGAGELVEDITSQDAVELLVERA